MTTEDRQLQMSWWRKLFGSAWLGCIGCVSLIWGIPGMLEDAAEWHRWFRVMNPGWSYAAAAAGGVLLGLWLVILVERHWVFIRRNAKDIGAVALLLVVVAAALFGAGWLIHYIGWVHEPTRMVWTHPTLSTVEQERVTAECEMKAMEVGGSGFKIGSPRFEYQSACLKSKGFVLKEAKR